MIATWLVLFVTFFLPCLPPARWQYYIYSPGSVALWMLSLLVAPVVVLLALQKWIRVGRTGGSP